MADQGIHQDIAAGHSLFCYIIHGPTVPYGTQPYKSLAEDKFRGRFALNRRDQMTDETERAAAIATVQEDNDRVRVTKYRFAPGAETTPHVHQWDYVVVPMTDGTLRLIAPDGSESQAQLTFGVSYARPAGVAHNVINAGTEELVFIEVEMKAHPIPTSDGG
jgi:quercetin dioxygenase-like cupin family protein